MGLFLVFHGLEPWLVSPFALLISLISPPGLTGVSGSEAPGWPDTRPPPAVPTPRLLGENIPGKGQRKHCPNIHIYPHFRSPAFPSSWTTGVRQQPKASLSKWGFFSVFRLPLVHKIYPEYYYYTIFFPAYCFKCTEWWKEHSRLDFLGCE